MHSGCNVFKALLMLRFLVVDIYGITLILIKHRAAAKLYFFSTLNYSRAIQGVLNFVDDR